MDLKQWTPKKEMIIKCIQSLRERIEIFETILDETDNWRAWMAESAGVKYRADVLAINCRPRNEIKEGDERMSEIIAYSFIDGTLPRGTRISFAIEEMGVQVFELQGNARWLCVSSDSDGVGMGFDTSDFRTYLTRAHKARVDRIGGSKVHRPAQRGQQLAFENQLKAEEQNET